MAKYTSLSRDRETAKTTVRTVRTARDQRKTLTKVPQDAHKPPTHSVRLHKGGRLSMHHLTHPMTSLVRHPQHESLPLVIERDRERFHEDARGFHFDTHFPARFPPPRDTAMPLVLSSVALVLALVAAPIRADDLTDPPCLEMDMSTMESALAAPCADPALACSNDDGCVCVRGVQTRLSYRFKD